MSSKTPKGKRKASEKPEPPGAPKKGKKASTKGEEKKSKAKKQLQLEAKEQKSYLAICNVTVVKKLGIPGIFTADVQETMCMTSDVGPYYHQACNQARNRMLDKLKARYCPEMPPWDSLSSTEKLGLFVLAVQVGTIKSIKTFALNVWIQEFKDGQPVGNASVSLSNSPEDDDPKSKINPEFDAEGNLVTNSDEAKASS